jgi:hypothetical protein
MILGVSIGRGFDDYGLLYKQLSAIEFTEIASVSNVHVKRFCKEAGKPLQEIQVFWEDIRGCKNIKTNQYGKPYNGDAMKEAMIKLADYADKIIEFGGGAYGLPKSGKEKLIVPADFKGVHGAPELKKTYKF